MQKVMAPRLFFLACLILLHSSINRAPSLTVQAASFNQSCTSGSPPCPALLAYRVSSPKQITIANISTLFGISPQSIFAANAYPPNSDPAVVLARQDTIRLQVPCPCAGNIRTGAATYTVAPDDFLFAIAENLYGSLVTYQEIANASNIADPNKILVGQNITIPYPCACGNSSDRGNSTLQMAYVVQKGESALGFSKQYGVSGEELRRLNPGVQFKQGDVIQLPVTACRANFSRDSVDSGLLVASGAYQITANGCVQCSCSADRELTCTKAPAAPRTCQLNCRSSQLQIGNYTSRDSSQGGCTVNSCLYDGFSRQGQIMTRLETTTSSTRCSSVEPPPAFAYSPEGQGLPEALAPAGANSPEANAPAPTAGSDTPILRPPGAQGGTPPSPSHAQLSVNPLRLATLGVALGMFAVVVA